MYVSRFLGYMAGGWLLIYKSLVTRISAGWEFSLFRLGLHRLHYGTLLISDQLWYFKENTGKGVCPGGAKVPRVQLKVAERSNSKGRPPRWPPVA